ncbi:hypothetical protein KGF56_002182 [Candida oxycetoniae]|uniref:Uncharacterized protein n=1 Tax=Candida oxycetoniae TaxID=497107 RepID=A0AAI9SXW6_9ASCO|nr:uncharacterized protein KGF56_002182 [Candida oxycetoniae]KAI3405017.2 hypothetical protein KGF56_002182 [Candida oxycetoniae]
MGLVSKWADADESRGEDANRIDKNGGGNANRIDKNGGGNANRIDKNGGGNEVFSKYKGEKGGNERLSKFKGEKGVGAMDKDRQGHLESKWKDISDSSSSANAKESEYRHNGVNCQKNGFHSNLHLSPDSKYTRLKNGKGKKKNVKDKRGEGAAEEGVDKRRADESQADEPQADERGPPTQAAKALADRIQLATKQKRKQNRKTEKTEKTEKTINIANKTHDEEERKKRELLEMLERPCRKVCRVPTLPTVLGTNRLHYTNNHPSRDSNKEIEKNKYDQLIINAIQSDKAKTFSSVNTNSPYIKESRRLPLRTILVLIATSSSLSMLVYIIVQYVKFQRDENEMGSTGVNQRERERSIFVPLWFNLNIWYRKSYSFPEGIKFLDPQYYEYLLTEMGQLCRKDPMDLKKGDIEDFLRDFRENHVNYALLERVSSVKKVREIFGLPLNVDSANSNDNGSDNCFKTWVEVKHPSVSGMQFEFTQNVKQGSNKPQNSVNFKWAVKCLNISSIAANSITSLRIGLNELESSNANVKTHEKSSGKVHKVKRGTNDFEINKNRDYLVNFSGEAKVSDKSGEKTATIKYVGTIDFDHLLINRGVKVLKIDLYYGDTVYRIV